MSCLVFFSAGIYLSTELTGVWGGCNPVVARQASRVSLARVAATHGREAALPARQQ